MTSSLESAQNVATEFIKSNIGAITAGAGGLALGGAVGYIAGSAISKNRSSKKRRYKAKTSKKRNRYNHKRHRKGRRYTPHTAGKRKDTSHKRIRQTKNGQPYIIMANGRARFIKRSSARRSRRTAGGRY